jgi:hypothetical protein
MTAIGTRAMLGLLYASTSIGVEGGFQTGERLIFSSAPDLSNVGLSN